MLGFTERLETGEYSLKNVIDNKEIENDKCPKCFTPLGDHNRVFSLKDINASICIKCQRKEFIEELDLEKRIKIKIFGVHFGCINERLLNLFDKTGIKNRTAWIINAAKEDFGVNLIDKEAVERLDIAVRIHCYIDKNEWLRDRLRKEVKKYGLIEKLLR